MKMDEAKSGSKKDRLSIFFAFAAIYIIWGSTYLAILIGLSGLPPFLMSAIRFLVAGLLLYGWCVFKGKQQPDISSLQKNTLYGIFMLVGGTVSVTWAEQYLPSSLAAIIVSSLPFWFVVLDKKQWQFYFSNKFIIAGLILGFAGVALLVGFGSTGYSSNLGTGNQLTGILVILTGGLAWTIGSLYSKYYPAKTSLLINAAIQLLSAGVFCMVVSLLAGEWRNFSFAAIKTSSWLAVLYLIIMGSLIAYLSFLYLLKSRPAAQVSTYVYVNPVVALLLGTWLANESIGLLKIIALTIILSGVVLVNLSKYKIRQPEL